MWFQYIFYSVLALLVILAIVYWQKVRLMGLWLQKSYQEIQVEMQKVTWPSRNDVIGSTIIVIVAVVIVTALIVVADQVLGFSMGKLLSLGKGA
jgi:preprotein translocase subunit SecE